MPSVWIDGYTYLVPDVLLLMPSYGSRWALVEMR